MIRLHALILGGLLAQLAPAQTTREDFTTFAKDAAKLASFRKGVAAMMALDTGKADKDLNPLGWKYQAYIHGVPASAATPAKQAAWTADENDLWETCQHSTWFFLAWHRMEMYYFERIMRLMAADPKLSIPYWNFGVPAMAAVPPVGARLPPEFRVVPTGPAPNSLYWPARDANMNKPPAVPDPAMPLAGADATTLDAFTQAAFFSNALDKGPMSFAGGATPNPQHGPGNAGTGQVESVPHNSVHSALGDGTETSMSDAGGAGLDPIFWPVHVNIDRAWACWQQLNPGTEPKAGKWLTEKFTFFDAGGTADKPAGVKKTLTGADIIAIAKQLNYMYDDNCAGFQMPAKPPVKKERPGLISSAEAGQEAGQALAVMDEDRSLSASARFDGVLDDKRLAVKIRIGEEMQARLRELARGGALPAGSVVLNISGLAIDNKSASPGYSVFLGLPEQGFPDQTGGYYVSQLAFFGVGHHRHDDQHHDNGRRFDVTRVVEGMIARGEWSGDEISVTFANTAALYTDRVTAPPALPEWRARFSSVGLTVR